MSTPVTYILSDYIREIWKEKVAHYEQPFESNEEMVRFMVHSFRAAHTVLPDDLLEILDKVSNYRESLPPYWLLKNLPMDDIYNIVTPSDGFLSKEKASVIAEACLAGVAQLLGSPFAFANERRGGGLFHLVAGRKGQETARTSESSLINLGFHVEQAFSRTLRPSFVLLYCLRPDRERKAATIISDVRDILPLLSPKSVALLQRPIFRFKIPDSFGSVNEMSEKMAVLEGELSDPRFSYSLDGKVVVDSADATEEADAYAALKELDDAMNCVENQHRVFLEAGDLLIINNHATAHGRTDFVLHDDGFNRWCERMIVRQDALYEARFGLIEKIGQYA